MKQSAGLTEVGPAPLRTHEMRKLKDLDERQKQEYFDKHLPHRLILLRTFRERFMNVAEHDPEEGDLYRCAKDANLLAIRSWSEFFGLCGTLVGAQYVLIKHKCSKPDDVRLISFLPNCEENITGFDKIIESIDSEDQAHIARAYVISSKEIAHLTTTFQTRSDDIQLLRRATDALEVLIRTKLYEPCNRQLPEHGKGSTW